MVSIVNVNSLSGDNTPEVHEGEAVLTVKERLALNQKKKKAPNENDNAPGQGIALAQLQTTQLLSATPLPPTMRINTGGDKVADKQDWVSSSMTLSGRSQTQNTLLRAPDIAIPKTAIQAERGSKSGNVLAQTASERTERNVAIPTVTPLSADVQAAPADDDRIVPTGSHGLAGMNDAMQERELLIPAAGLVKKNISIPANPPALSNVVSQKVAPQEDNSHSDLTWHFKSWGDGETHLARLVFTDPQSVIKDVTIIPSDETVRSALMKQLTNDILPNVVIENADTQEREKGNHQSPESEEEEEA